MKITYYSNYGTIDEYIETFENIETIEFENQEKLNNGMWLHLKRKDGFEFSLEFEPDKDLWKIENANYNRKKRI